ncbi:MAG: sterol desaturase family protein [Caulobacteraceae bacterium]|nr:sterol desaturase family protein [Caulobacteraceae bacterium]
MPWSIINLGVLFLAFGLLAGICPCNREQPRFARRELADDALYWFSAIFYADLGGLFLKAAAQTLAPTHSAGLLAAIAAGYGWASHAPLLVQAILILLALDFIQYWLHRLFHGRALWPFHAIHHSAEQVDWTTAYRFHPVNFILYNTGAVTLVKLAGFSPLAFVIIGPFNLVASALVHANLDWTFGPFRYLLASPVFHRWHHVRDPSVRNRNFAPTFPILDVIFGTFYMPKGILPRDYGVEGVPPHFLGQLAYPFVVYAERLGLAPATKAARAAA